MRITLFNPPVTYYTGTRYVFNPALGLPIISSVLRQAGHESNVIDLEFLNHTPDQFINSIQDGTRDWIGFTALTSSAKGAKECITGLRNKGYKGRIVIGGVHATIDPQDALSWGVDLVVTGECEGNIVQLLESGATGIHTGIQMPIENIPIPDWGHHDPVITAYPGNPPGIARPESISMLSRGCPYHCIYCGNTIYGGKKTFYRPPVNVEAEMRDLKNRGIKCVFIYDDELISPLTTESWMEDVANRVNGLGLLWKTQGRCSEKYVTEKLLRDAYRAGCRVIMWGIESFSPNVLKAVKKGITPADIWHTLRLSKKAGIKNFVFTMVGNYQETEDDLIVTVNEIGKAYNEGLIDYRQTTVCTALPGTELWEIQKREGWWNKPPDTGSLMHQSYQGTPWLSAQRIVDYIHAIGRACPVGM